MSEPDAHAAPSRAVGGDQGLATCPECTHHRGHATSCWDYGPHCAKREGGDNVPCLCVNEWHYRVASSAQLDAMERHAFGTRHNNLSLPLHLIEEARLAEEAQR